MGVGGGEGMRGRGDEHLDTTEDATYIYLLSPCLSPSSPSMLPSLTCICSGSINNLPTSLRRKV